MTLKECSALLTPVAVALGVQVDAPTFRAYHRALQDVPVGLLQAACDYALRAPRVPYEPRWPTAPTFRQWAEHARQVWLKANPWTACEACDTNGGFIEARDERGVPRLARCACWRAHQQRIASAGMSEPLALPPARDEVSA